MLDKENSTPNRPKGLLKNWLSLIGVVIMAGSVFSCLFLFATELFLPRSNPYMGILIYILAPIFFFLGHNELSARDCTSRRNRCTPALLWRLGLDWATCRQNRTTFISPV